MIKNWAPLTEDIKALMRTMRGDAPNVMKAFSGLAQAASAPQAIDGKTKELIASASRWRSAATTASVSM
jgi:alkylhydroperoxidase/carboxymuconolactone decarboxylase family protein YurZ